ncbi:MAG: hypothetical protein ABJA71_09980 [Ginsengibacter sp.]
MKKIAGFLSLIALFTITACTDPKPKEVKKEVTAAPSSAPATTTEKKTTIVLDKNGAKVATKKVDVTINPNK